VSVEVRDGRERLVQGKVVGEFLPFLWIGFGLIVEKRKYFSKYYI
jgi:hypothetical protein